MGDGSVCKYSFKELPELDLLDFDFNNHWLHNIQSAVIILVDPGAVRLRELASGEDLLLILRVGLGKIDASDRKRKAKISGRQIVQLLGVVLTPEAVVFGDHAPSCGKFSGGQPDGG